MTKVLRGQQSIQFTASNNLDAIKALYPEDIFQYSEYECQFQVVAKGNQERSLTLQ